MRRFRGVVQSNIEPRDKEIIWKCGDRLLYWDGAWKDLISYNASDIRYTPNGAETTNVEHALNILWKYTGAPAPSPEEGTSINVNAVLTKRE